MQPFPLLVTYVTTFLLLNMFILHKVNDMTAGNDPATICKTGEFEKYPDKDWATICTEIAKVEEPEAETGQEVIDEGSQTIADEGVEEETTEYFVPPEEEPIRPDADEIALPDVVEEPIIPEEESVVPDEAPVDNNEIPSEVVDENPIVTEIPEVVTEVIPEIVTEFIPEIVPEEEPIVTEIPEPSVTEASLEAPTAKVYVYPDYIFPWFKDINTTGGIPPYLPWWVLTNTTTIKAGVPDFTTPDSGISLTEDDTVVPDPTNATFPWWNFAAGAGFPWWQFVNTTANSTANSTSAKNSTFPWWEFAGMGAGGGVVPWAQFINTTSDPAANATTAAAGTFPWWQFIGGGAGAGGAGVPWWQTLNKTGTITAAPPAAGGKPIIKAPAPAPAPSIPGFPWWQFAAPGAATGGAGFPWWQFMNKTADPASPTGPGTFPWWQFAGAGAGGGGFPWWQFSTTNAAVEPAAPAVPWWQQTGTPTIQSKNPFVFPRLKRNDNQKPATRFVYPWWQHINKTVIDQAKARHDFPWWNPNTYKYTKSGGMPWWKNIKEHPKVKSGNHFIFPRWKKIIKPKTGEFQFTNPYVDIQKIWDEHGKSHINVVTPVKTIDKVLDKNGQLVDVNINGKHVNVHTHQDKPHEHKQDHDHQKPYVHVVTPNVEVTKVRDNNGGQPYVHINTPYVDIVKSRDQHEVKIVKRNENSQNNDEQRNVYKDERGQHVEVTGPHVNVTKFISSNDGKSYVEIQTPYRTYTRSWTNRENQQDNNNRQRENNDHQHENHDRQHENHDHQHVNNDHQQENHDHQHNDNQHQHHEHNNNNRNDQDDERQRREQERARKDQESKEKDEREQQRREEERVRKEQERQRKEQNRQQREENRHQHNQNHLDRIQKIEEHPGCPYCRKAIDEFLIANEAGVDRIILKNITKTLCWVLDIDDDTICNNLIDLNFDIAKYVIDENQNYLSGELICGIMLQDHNCNYDDTTPDWSINIDKRSYIKSRKDTIPISDTKLTIVHISDTHFDPKYLEGSNAACNTPVCCRVDSDKTNNLSNMAGKWGDYRNCDSPWISIENLFNQIKNSHGQTVDYIYATGDYVDHAVWETSLIGNQNSIKLTFDSLRQLFPDTPIYPVLGNHEPHPANIITPKTIKRKEFLSTPLYEFLAKSWSWLPKVSTETISTGGYYTALVRQGLRVIALNNNACIQFNFWILLDSSFLTEELQWLHDTLLEAERNSEKVHILAHVPSGDVNCYKRWAREYKRIINRFWDTISGQFNGHSHRDLFNLYYDNDDSELPINVAWNGGGSSTYGFVNPNYRVYSVEPITFQVTDHETWIYNLTEANLDFKNEPHWYKEYTFKNEYNVTDLSPVSLDGLLSEFSNDLSKLKKYWQFNIKQSDSFLEFGCDNECLSSELCKIVTTEYRSRNLRCEQLMEAFDKTIKNTS